MPMPLRSSGLRYRLTGRSRRFLAASAAIFGLLSAATLSGAVNAVEYQLKAGFLFNFAKFVEWPPRALAPGETLRLGIIAPDEVYAVMERSLSGKKAGDRPLQVERITPAQLTEGAALPNIIFVYQKQEAGLPSHQVAELAEKHSVLLVGESPGFATTTGMIGFVQRGENLRYQVNLASAQRAGLKLSARLSGLAEMVNTAQ